MQATVVDLSLKVYLEVLSLGGLVNSVTGDQIESIIKVLSEEALATLIKCVTETEVDMILNNLRNVLSDDEMQDVWKKTLKEAIPDIAGGVLKNTIEKALTKWAGIDIAYEFFMNSATVAQMSVEVGQLIQAKNLNDPTIQMFLAPTKN